MELISNFCIESLVKAALEYLCLKNKYHLQLHFSKKAWFSTEDLKSHKITLLVVENQPNLLSDT